MKGIDYLHDLSVEMQLLNTQMQAVLDKLSQSATLENNISQFLNQLQSEYLFYDQQIQKQINTKYVGDSLAELQLSKLLPWGEKAEFFIEKMSKKWVNNKMRTVPIDKKLFHLPLQWMTQLEGRDLTAYTMVFYHLPLITWTMAEFLTFFVEKTKRDLQILENCE